MLFTCNQKFFHTEDAVKPVEAAKEDIEEDQTVQITGK